MNFKNWDVYQLKEIAAQKKLICFGMGKVFRDFLQDFPSMELEKNIFAIADNKMDKKDESVLVNGISIRLMDPNELRELDDGVILISCADISGVYEQLEQYGLPDGISCCAVYFVRSQTNRTDDGNRRNPLKFRITQEQQIPKKIHYCWFGKSPIPERNLKWMESWKKCCPDYEIIRWDEGNYDVSKNAYIHEAYQQKKWGFVSDYARLDVVFHYGGIYLDTDVEIIRSYDELLYQKAFAGVEADRKIALGLGFGARKGHPVIGELMQLYENISFIQGNGNSNLTTCVTLQHPFYKKKGFIDNGEYQIIDGLTVYPETVLAAEDFYTGELRITSDTFSIHHYDGSWLDNKNKSGNNSNKKLFKRLIRGGDE